MKLRESTASASTSAASRPRQSNGNSRGAPAPPPPQTIARLVTGWFGKNARDLPWRRTSDPYAIWISEVMLQQTQVKTVIPYWERWMRLFPTVQALAAADEQVVLKTWEGLGYYSRARNLQKASCLICSEHGGAFPKIFDEILALPGIGRYTAGAICSIAFGQPAPILDGNVARVLSRVFALRGNVKSNGVRAILWTKSEQLVRAAAELPKALFSPCSALNQGLMELGALVCLPRGPMCLACPLQSCCIARRTGCTDEIPEAPPKPKARQRSFEAYVLLHGNSVLVQRRSESVVNAGLWEFPSVETTLNNLAMPALPCPLSPFHTIKHTITNNRITLRAHRGTINGAAASVARDLQSEWMPLRQILELPFSSAHSKIRKRLLAEIAVEAASSG